MSGGSVGPTSEARDGTSLLYLPHGRYFSTTEQLLFVGCLTSKQHDSVSQGWICSDKVTC